MKDQKYVLSIIGLGGTRYLSDENSSELQSSSRRVELEYLKEGAWIVDYLSVEDDPNFVTWVIQGPMVAPWEKEISPCPKPDSLVSEVHEYIFPHVHRAGYIGLDQWPLDKWLDALKRFLPKVRIGRVYEGEVVWVHPKPREEGKQMSLFQESEVR